MTAVGQDRPGSDHTTVEHGEVDGAASDQAQPGQCVDDRRCGWRGAGLRRLRCRPCAGDRRIIEWSGDSPAGPDEVFFAGEKLMVEQLDDKAGHSGLGQTRCPGDVGDRERAPCIYRVEDQGHASDD
jgi:hypothetical protein